MRGENPSVKYEFIPKNTNLEHILFSTIINMTWQMVFKRRKRINQFSFKLGFCNSLYSTNRLLSCLKQEIDE